MGYSSLLMGMRRVDEREERDTNRNKAEWLSS